jgi:hypothetical protein
MTPVPTSTSRSAPVGPQLFPRVIADHDELGYPLLAHDCPFCAAAALIINEWDAVECLTCAWREFEPDGPRATFRDFESELASLLAAKEAGR